MNESTPAKSTFCGEEERISFEDASPTKSLSEIFKFPTGFNITKEEKYLGSNRVIGENIDNDEYENFILLNLKFKKVVYLRMGFLLWSSPQNEDVIEDQDSPIHNGAFRGIARTMNFYFQRLREDYPNINFDELNSGEKVSGEDDQFAIIPDFMFKLDGMDEPFVVGETQYSLDLADGHTRAQGYLGIVDIRGVIIINIRYPWNTTNDGSRYDVGDGHLLFLYYTNDAETHEMTPARIVSFGNTELTFEEAQHVANITHFPVMNIEGVGMSPGLQCTQTNRNLPVFVHAIPPSVILVNNLGDEVTLTGHPINAVPEHLILKIYLYDLKEAIVNGCGRLNRLIERGQATVVRRTFIL